MRVWETCQVLYGMYDVVTEVECAVLVNGGVKGQEKTIVRWERRDVGNVCVIVYGMCHAVCEE